MSSSGTEVPGALSDPTRVSGDEIRFAGAGGDEVGGYLAHPTEAGSYAGLLILPLAFGISDHYRDLARRFANVGYSALAVDPYSREGAPDPADIADITAKMFGVPDARMVDDLNAAAKLLLGREDANGRLGCLGFSAGGRQALAWASQTPAADAVAAVYAGFVHSATPEATTTAERPVAVIDLLGGLACPLLLVAASEDDNPSPSDIEKAAEQARSLGKDVTTSVYAGVGHAFFSDDQDWAYQPEAAGRLWAELDAFFAANLRETP